MSRVLRPGAARAERRDPVVPACLVAGCTAYAFHGYQPVRGEPGKWACAAHQHLLRRETAPAAPLPATPRQAGTLFDREG